MVELFLEGGPFMWPILLLLLAGLGLVGERAYSLNQSKVDSDGFMNSLRGALKSGGSKKAMDVCAGHDGPVSNICEAGLSKVGKGSDQIEKAIENAGSLEMAFLEKNMGWLEIGRGIFQPGTPRGGPVRANEKYVILSSHWRS